MDVSRDEPGIPIVIGDGMSCLEATRYAPPTLRDRLLTVLDGHMATV